MRWRWGRGKRWGEILGSKTGEPPAGAGKELGASSPGRRHLRRWGSI